MSDQLPLGKIIEGEQCRDAVHIAVAPVIAAERLVPGGHIGFVGGDTEHVTARAKVLLGVVDPFLTNIVEHGQRFFMFLYPQTITSLRHEWTHPAFQNVETHDPVLTGKPASEKWLRDFAAEVGVTYEVLMDTAARVADGGWALTLNYDTPDVVYQKREEAWKHYEVVSGRNVEESVREDTLFSCSC